MVPVIVNGPNAPTAAPPGTVHVTVVPDGETAHPPALVTVKPGGRLSTIVTGPVATDGPLFTGFSVYVSEPPACAGSGASDFVSDRSATRLTPVVAVDVSFAALGSGSARVTVAVLVSVAPCNTVDATVPAITTSEAAPGPRLASEHVTVPDGERAAGRERADVHDEARG